MATIAGALASKNKYPIPDETIEVICVDNGLSPTDTYTQEIGESQNFQLAYADTLVWLHDAPSLVEQEVGINNAISIRQDMLDRANQIYGLYNSAKASANTIGFIGEDYNG